MARKRAPLAENMQVARRSQQPEPPSAPDSVTSIHISRDMLRLLRDAANNRAYRAGRGRPSVSDVVRDLLERHRDELEAEARG